MSFKPARLFQVATVYFTACRAETSVKANMSRLSQALLDAAGTAQLLVRHPRSLDRQRSARPLGQ